jgi:D-alanine-D-alanine ligase
MASLDREIPAHIPELLKNRIEETARRAFVACRLRGVPRIDFMYKKDTDELFLTEINPIPGSLAFYLWEAAGIPFQQQITDAIVQAIIDAKKDTDLILEYKSDIVEKFCA